MTYEDRGRKLGIMVDAKAAAYGDSVAKTALQLRILYPGGVPLEAYTDMLALVRVLDKINRIAAGNTRAFGESSWQDIAGYGLLMSADREDV
ncbi:MAG: hypothetical protein GY844_21480 [Bradyrhizobium sp.]|nr:hypothetical protein [Bradyrhizobium sp.]